MLRPVKSIMIDHRETKDARLLNPFAKVLAATIASMSLCLFSSELKSFAHSQAAGAILYMDIPQAVMRSSQKLGGAAQGPSSSLLAANTQQPSAPNAPKSLLSPSMATPAQPGAQSPSTFGAAPAPLPTITIPVPNSLPVYKSPAAPKSVLTPTPSAPTTVNLQSASQFLPTTSTVSTPGQSMVPNMMPSASAGSPSLPATSPQLNGSTPTSAPTATSSTPLNLTPSSNSLQTVPTITSGTSSLYMNRQAPSPPSLGPGLGTAAPPGSGAQAPKTNPGLTAPAAVSH